MIAPGERLASAALTCLIAIASSACNAVFGLGPIEELAGDASIPDSGPCTRARGNLKISDEDIFSDSFPAFTLDLADSKVTVASSYDAMADRSSFTIKTLQVPAALCSAALTVSLAGEPVAGKVYEIVVNETDLHSAMQRNAWVKFAVDDDTKAMCSGPAEWEPDPALEQSLTVEAFDSSVLAVRLSQVQLKGVVRSGNLVTVDGLAQSSCFSAH